MGNQHLVRRLDPSDEHGARWGVNLNVGLSAVRYESHGVSARAQMEFVGHQARGGFSFESR